MKFEWDPDKAENNLKKHRVSFEDAKTVFEDSLSVSVIDPDHSENEERWLTIGMDRSGRLLTVAHTYGEDDDEEVTRIISARRATARERRAYE